MFDLDLPTPTFDIDDEPVPIILLNVCAWHTPQAELDALNRQYPNQISHGICPSCAQGMLGERV